MRVNSISRDCIFVYIVAASALLVIWCADLQSKSNLVAASLSNNSICRALCFQSHRCRILWACWYILRCRAYGQCCHVVRGSMVAAWNKSIPGACNMQSHADAMIIDQHWITHHTSCFTYHVSTVCQHRSLCCRGAVRQKMQKQASCEAISLNQRSLAGKRFWKRILHCSRPRNSPPHAHETETNPNTAQTSPAANSQLPKVEVLTCFLPDCGRISLLWLTDRCLKLLPGSLYHAVSLVTNTLRTSGAQTVWVRPCFAPAHFSCSHEALLSFNFWDLALMDPELHRLHLHRTFCFSKRGLISLARKSKLRRNWPASTW